MKQQQKISLHSVFILILFTAILSACVSETVEPAAPTIAPGDIADAATAQMVVTQFLSAWQNESYDQMYAMLSTLSQDAISLDGF